MGIVINALLLGGGEAVAFIFVANATPNTEIYAIANKTYHATADANGKACIAVGETGTFSLTNGIMVGNVTVPANGGVVQASLHVRRTGSVVSFNTPSSVPLLSLVGEINPVQNLNGYSNPWVGGAGKNLWTAPYVISKPSFYSTGWAGVTTDGEWVVQTGHSHALGGCGGACCYNLPAGTYTISCDVDTSQCVDNKYTATFLTKYVGESYTQSAQPNLTASHYTRTITLAKAVDCIAIRITSYGNSNSAVVRYKHIQLETGSSATEYEPYSNICPISGFANANIYLEDEYDAGATPAYTINLGDTRYGGSLNVTTGVLTIDRQFVQLDGNSSISLGGSGTAQVTEKFPYWATINISAAAKNDYTKWKFSHGKVVYPAYDGIYRVYYQSETMIRVVIGTDTLCDTVDKIKAFLQAQYDNGTPLQIVYELATPTTVQLTAQQINTLVGDNVLWMDTGDITVEY